VEQAWPPVALGREPLIRAGRPFHSTSYDMAAEATYTRFRPAATRRQPRPAATPGRVRLGKL
jgi:hypothetical protein